jgi:hypothetical protein
MANVRIEMLATLSGDGESWGPGSVLTVEADEAERLVSLGAAVLVPHPLDHDGDGVPGGSPAGENATRRRGRKAKGADE